MAETQFDLEGFLPYLLNQAAEAAGREFAAAYRGRYGMTRTQWRVLAHLGRFGALTATEICRRAMEEKTGVSRAVQALEERGWLVRDALAEDRRAEALSLTPAGHDAYQALAAEAIRFDALLRSRLGEERAAGLAEVLTALIGAARD
ncbi:MarR family transcriptional regulator [Defluviimonas sp. D31]|uniref:MarR family winged helix-turn-helix transcriptional regulator n=1 Tax=Defluviimonas sp. D31 TaxID=3083253 RepID=UPI00296FD04B|nr:MarR family transcriptional regulator [Defluviimonas sp. D31]MDW4549884.1 MarR family transcriptional regulator [Defluviimonas sp. D31]